jgi:hypothetical protein
VVDGAALAAYAGSGVKVLALGSGADPGPDLLPLTGVVQPTKPATSRWTTAA